MKSKENIPSLEEIAEIQEERTLSDAELIKGGAEYKADEKGNLTFGPTRRQIKSIVKEHEERESIKKRLEAVVDKLDKALEGSNETLDRKNKLELPEGAIIMEIIPDPEITSVETAINKLEKEDNRISDYHKEMLTEVNWKEKLKGSYEVVSISVGELFQDTNSHFYKGIKEKAKEYGLDLVPANLVPSICLNYSKKNKESITFAMERISARSLSRVFRLNGTVLAGDDAYDNVGWSHSHRLFFVRK